jgi:hypothetical protein
MGMAGIYAQPYIVDLTVLCHVNHPMPCFPYIAAIEVNDPEVSE